MLGFYMISCSLCSSVLSYNCLDFYNNLLDLYPSLMSPFPADPITCYSLWSIALLISLCYLLHLVSCKIVQNFWVRCVPNFWVAFLVLLYSSCSILIFFYHPFLPLMLTLTEPTSCENCQVYATDEVSFTWNSLLHVQC